ncbi:hypothetical protein MMC07_000444, partial [Pseudocyphellaria aurata]|nr:hypothetical protein [Pseudocyphellaria aurata]
MTGGSAACLTSGLQAQSQLGKLFKAIQPLYFSRLDSASGLSDMMLLGLAALMRLMKEELARADGGGAAQQAAAADGGSCHGSLCCMPPLSASQNTQVCAGLPDAGNEICLCIRHASPKLGADFDLLMLTGSWHASVAGSTRQHPLVRIDLREASVMEGPSGADADLGNIGEEAEHEENVSMSHQADMPHKLAAGAD